MFQRQLSSIIKISTIFACFVLIQAGPRKKVANSVPVTNSKSTNAVELQETLPALEISLSQDVGSVKPYSTLSLTCKVSGVKEVPKLWWTKSGTNLTGRVFDKSKSSVTIDIEMTSSKENGNYTCFATTKKGALINKTVEITVAFESGKITGGKGDQVRLNKPAILSCNLEGNTLKTFNWLKIDNRKGIANLTVPANIANATHTDSQMTLYFESVTFKDNGTYECSVDNWDGTSSSLQVDLIVTDVPQITINFTKSVGKGMIYLNWTVYEQNDRVKFYFMEHLKNGTKEWQNYPNHIGRNDTSYLLKGLETRTGYQLRISANNSIGRSSWAQSNPNWITTLDEDPEFIPSISINETTFNWITIAWKGPPPKLQDYVQYYNITTTHKNGTDYYKCPVESTGIYNLTHLVSPVTTYRIKIAACNNYTKQCGRSSAEINLSASQKSDSARSRATPINLHAATISSIIFLIIFNL